MENFAFRILVVAAFLSIFAIAIKKDRINVIPFIILFYSNINGLLDWEDFALKGYVKFQDYGLVLVALLIVWRSFEIKRGEPGYMKVARETTLYNTINIYWMYMFGLFILSVAIQGMVWSVKMARVFFYGTFIYLLYFMVADNPLVKFKRIISSLMWITLFFGCLYIAYNLADIPIYPKAPQEVFLGSYLDKDVKRNFSGFPTFANFFVFYFIDRILRNDGNKIFNAISLFILLACVVFMLTRYTLVVTGIGVIIVAIYRKQTPSTILRLIGATVLLIALVPILYYIGDSHILALVKRFEEIVTGSNVLESSTGRVRVVEFQRIFSNVMDFNPFSGFGFVLPWFFGYRSSLYHAGSADNGYSNMLGVTGFIGVIAFLVLIGSWLVINRRLRAMDAEDLSRVNFAFIIFILLGMMNNASAGYMHYFGVFMAYDLIVYSYLKYQKDQSSGENKLKLNGTTWQSKEFGRAI
jgi:hypothetical protein